MWWLSLVLAHAQGIGDAGELWANTPALDESSVAYANALHAARVHNQLYGPVGFFDRELLPGIQDLGEEGGVAVALEIHQLYGVESVPEASPGTGAHRFDAVAGSFGIAARYRFASVFYISNSTMTHAQPTGLETVVMDEIAILYQSAIVVPVTSLIFVGVSGSGDFDFPPIQAMVGGTLHSPAIDLYAAWLLPNDLYTNLNNQNLRLFAESVWEDTSFGEDTLARAPLLRAGMERGEKVLDALRWLERTRAFVRRLRFVGAEEVEPAEPASADQSDSFWTMHLGHGISLEDRGGGEIRIDGALSWQPTVLLHDLHLRAELGERDRGRQGRAEEYGQLILQGGLTSLPAVPRYGLEEQRLLQLLLGVEMGGEEGGLSVGLALNDPEVLSTFPYARNSLRLYIRGHGLLAR